MRAPEPTANEHNARVDRNAVFHTLVPANRRSAQSRPTSGAEHAVLSVHSERGLTRGSTSPWPHDRNRCAGPEGEASFRRSRSSAAASCERQSRRWRHRMGLSGGTSDAAVADGQIVRRHKWMTGANRQRASVGPQGQQTSMCSTVRSAAHGRHCSGMRRSPW